MFRRLTPLVKNLLFINIGIAVLQALMRIDLGPYFGLHFILADEFKPYQFVTYMFLHSTQSMMHIFGNMFALFIFGPLLEQFLGAKKFLILYMVTGVGAGLFYTGVNYVEVQQVRRDVQAYVSNPNSQDFNRLLIDHGDVIGPGSAGVYDFVDKYSRDENNPDYRDNSVSLAWQLFDLYGRYNMVGASGAVFGILAAFALFFPNTELFLLFLPFPIKAKYLVGAYILFEVFAELQRAPGDNVAHLAHIGGALIAFFLVRAWKRGRNNFY